MAVSGNDSNKIDMSSYDNFKQKQISTLSNVKIDQEAVAGVTPEMATNINAGLTTYLSNIASVTKSLNDFVTAIINNKAVFQGSVNASLQEFSTSIDSLVNSYTNGLAAAEHEIAKNVAAAYLQNDQTISGSVDTQTQSMEGFGQ